MGVKLSWEDKEFSITGARSLGISAVILAMLVGVFLYVAF